MRVRLICINDWGHFPLKDESYNSFPDDENYFSLSLFLALSLSLSLSFFYLFFCFYHSVHFSIFLSLSVSLRTNLIISWTVMISWPFWWILVHFGAPLEQPHDPSPSNFQEVINDMYPMHQGLQNATSPTFKAQFVQEILIKHMQFPWVKMDKSYHHLPCRKKTIFLEKHYGKYFIEAGYGWNTCLLRKRAEKRWAISQITRRFHGWHVRVKADFHEIET